MRLWHEQIIHLLPKTSFLVNIENVVRLGEMDGKRNIKQ